MNIEDDKKLSGRKTGRRGKVKLKPTGRGQEKKVASGPKGVDVVLEDTL